MRAGAGARIPARRVRTTSADDRDARPPPDKPPATPQKPRKVLIWSRIPSAGFQHSSIPLAAQDDRGDGQEDRRLDVDDVAGTSTDITAENLKQYDAIFLSNTTGTFLDDPNDQAVTDARRKAFQDFLTSGKGVAGIHATGDSYHGGGRGAAPAPERRPLARPAAPGARRPGAARPPQRPPAAAAARRCPVR